MSDTRSTKRLGEPLEIPVLYAVITADDGDEGIAGLMTAQGWMPLVFSKLSSLEMAIGLVREIADRSGETIRVVRFERAEVLKVIVPGEKPT